jgi:hypothetical protein
MLSYAYISDGWELVAIRGLDDGFASIVDSKKQVFLFDDFLGKIALDVNALAAKDSDLARFMKRIRNSPNARFILTTRAYIFEEARRVSEHLADKRLDISKYVLDVGAYTRRIRARILYNHLLVAGTPHAYVEALVASGKLAAIVDHRNYNPRVVEWMTEEVHLSDILPGDYPAAFLDALANPHRLWDTAFRTHMRFAILREFEHVDSSIEGVNSESTLDDHITALKRMAPRAGIGNAQLETAVAAVKRRIEELEEETTVADPPAFTGPTKELDKFDDADLRNLFAPLLERA